MPKWRFGAGMTFGWHAIQLSENEDIRNALPPAITGNIIKDYALQGNRPSGGSPSRAGVLESLQALEEALLLGLDVGEDEDLVVETVQGAGHLGPVRVGEDAGHEGR